MTLVDTIVHPRGEASGWKFELDDPAEPGSLTQIEVEYDAPVVAPALGEVLPHRVRELALTVEFHPDAMPDWVEEVTEGGVGGPGRFVPFKGRRSVTVSRRNFGPGMLLLRWGWD